MCSKRPAHSKALNEHKLFFCFATAAVNTRGRMSRFLMWVKENRFGIRKLEFELCPCHLLSCVTSGKSLKPSQLSFFTCKTGKIKIVNWLLTTLRCKWGDLCELALPTAKPCMHALFCIVSVMDWMFVPTKDICWNPKPQCEGIRSWVGPWEVIRFRWGLEGRVPMMEGSS